MTIDEDDPGHDNEEYDEEADDDFEAQGSDIELSSSAEEDELPAVREVKSGKKTSSQPKIEDLDSGDEVTINERQKLKRRQKKKSGGNVSSDEDQDEAWRAKTRSMRAQQQAEQQKRTLTSTATSTIDVNKIWEQMNTLGPLPPIQIETQEDILSSPKKQESVLKDAAVGIAVEETITIKRQFKFAGEIHAEEKVVPKSSAEAKLWLAQQEGRKHTNDGAPDETQRPIRKISRFDPNYANLEAFRNYSIKAQPNAFKGPKLNVVEKSKMDWASHVDAEGLQEELNIHAKAKDAYLNRMDFLGQVEQRKEEDARLARQKR